MIMPRWYVNGNMIGKEALGVATTDEKKEARVYTKAIHSRMVKVFFIYPIYYHSYCTIVRISCDSCCTIAATCPIEDATGPGSPTKKTLPHSPESQRINEVKKCRLMDITGKKLVVAEGRWATNDPNQKVHFRLGSNAVKVWVDIVKVSDAAVWKPSEEIEMMEDALGTVIA